MTQTACDPVREPVSQIQCEAARLDVQPETLSSRAALHNEAIDESLIPCLKIKGPYRRGMAPCAGIALCVGCAGTRHKEPDSSDQYLDGFRTFPTRVSRVRVTRAYAVYGGVRVFDASCGRLQDFTVRPNRRRTWGTAFLADRRQRPDIRQRGNSAPARLPAGVCQEPKTHGKRLPHAALPVPRGDVPTIATKGVVERMSPCCRSGGLKKSRPASSASRSAPAAAKVSMFAKPVSRKSKSWKKTVRQKRHWSAFARAMKRP